MRLLLATIRNNIQIYDEGVYNQEFPVRIQLETLSLCSQLTHTPLDHEKIQNAYTRLIRARIQKDRRAEQNSIDTLKKILNANNHPHHHTTLY